MVKKILISSYVLLATYILFLYFGVQNHNAIPLDTEIGNTSHTANSTIPVQQSTTTDNARESTSTSTNTSISTSTNTSIRTSMYSAPVQSQQVQKQLALPTFHYTFNVEEVFEESATEYQSASRYFWLNSGGKLLSKDGVGSTIIGALGMDDPWRTSYARTSPESTANGTFPQNLFRLVTRTEWNNSLQELDFFLVQIHALDTRVRDAFSGIFLMSRYLNGDNLYYAGIRMDGKAVIKKKYKGTYYTLAEKQLFSSPIPYNRVTFPNLIPLQQWYRMGSKTETTPSGTVRISFLFSRTLIEPLEVVLVAIDTGTFGPPLASTGRVGIRTDFADVRFDNYILTEIFPPR